MTERYGQLGFQTPAAAKISTLQLFINKGSLLFHRMGILTPQKYQKGILLHPAQYGLFSKAAEIFAHYDSIVLNHRHSKGGAVFLHKPVHVPQMEQNKMPFLSRVPLQHPPYLLFCRLSGHHPRKQIHLF